jgi:hypothetical protein
MAPIRAKLFAFCGDDVITVVLITTLLRRLLDVMMVSARSRAHVSAAERMPIYFKIVST